MDQKLIGQFICKKRKETNLTQEQLAEKLGVSNKTVSKWENGKCMPDYSVVESLCRELGITMGELMDGEAAENGSLRTYDDAQTLDLLRRIQELENQRSLHYGLLLIVMGMAVLLLSQFLGGSDFRDFLSGLMLGISIATTLTGIFCLGRYVGRGIRADVMHK